jgi:UDP-glucose 4-epimerase
LLEDPSLRGRVYNLGRDELIGISRLAELVRTRLESSSEIRLLPYGEAFDEHFEDLRTRRPDLTRIREAIGFSPSIELSSTIDDLASAIQAEGEA